MKESRRSRVRARRRMVVGAGLAIVALLTVTACIFDKGDYQGGGRNDKGASAQTGEPTSTTSGSTSSTATSTSAPDSGSTADSSILDVLADGG